jgi:acylphosphatase
MTSDADMAGRSEMDAGEMDAGEMAGRGVTSGEMAGGERLAGETAGGEMARPGSEPAGDAAARLTAWIAGRVQGVGFRWWVRARALELGLAGSAENLQDGRVKVIAEGPVARCRELLALLAGPGTPGRVTGVTQRWDDPRGGMAGFAER